MLPTAGPAEAAIAGLIRLDPISAKTTGNLLQELLPLILMNHQNVFISFYISHLEKYITVENAILHNAFFFMNSLSVRMTCYTNEKSCMMCYSSP